MNQVEIVGNLTKDPVVKATSGGKVMARFSVAVDRSYVTNGGESKTLTDFINVVAWGPTAEAAGNYLKKGSRVFVLGRYTSRAWDTPEGVRKYITEVNTNFIACPLGSWEWKKKETAPSPSAGRREITGGRESSFRGGNFGGFPQGPGGMNPFDDNPFMQR